MDRHIVRDLLRWKADKNRKPLLLTGARQVGKTWIVNNFGKNHYDNCVYFNLESSAELRAVFAGNLEPASLFRQLSAISGQSVFAEKTLIVFDEIQSCNRALTSLKYFRENAPAYHIIATGSLLGIAVNRDDYSFPVGNVDRMTLHPMDFEEFLWAAGEHDILELIREAYASYSEMPLHGRAMSLYRRHLLCGGMPRGVFAHLNDDSTIMRAEQASIIDNYIADMAKYASPEETIRIMAAWNSVPAQLAKANRKFQYKAIKSGARAKDYEFPLHWLASAGILNICPMITEGKPPLAAYRNDAFFKAYVVDTGLLCAFMGVLPESVETGLRDFERYKGALSENYVMQALCSKGFKPCYWVLDGRAEVDFVFQDAAGAIVPLEVKSADNVRSASLSKFIGLYGPEYAIRVSSKNFGFENGIKSIPPYALFCLACH
jgi:predicted AAA+ superfamily ATPase